MSSASDRHARLEAVIWGCATALTTGTPQQRAKAIDEALATIDGYIASEVSRVITSPKLLAARLRLAAASAERTGRKP